MEKAAVGRLLEGAGECAARHPVLGHGVVEALEGRLGPLVMADPVAHLLNRLLGLGAIDMHPDARLLQVGLKAKDGRLAIETRE